MSWKFEHVAGPFTLTEGPAWDGTGLLFTDIENSRVLRYDPSSGECSTFRDGTNRANGLMFDPAGRLHACEQSSGRIVIYQQDGGVEVLAGAYGGKRLNSPNDLAIDRLGRIWFTDPRYGDQSGRELDHQSVYRLDPLADGSWGIERVAFDMTRPNGILVSPDQETLYVSQAGFLPQEKRELRAYPIRADGSLGNHAVLHNFFPYRGIDGMCLDVEGNIIATAGQDEAGPGSMIYVFAPNGRILETHPFPANRPTNCTFGGALLTTLYVTSIEGHLHRAETGRKGLLHFPAEGG